MKVLKFLVATSATYFLADSLRVRGPFSTKSPTKNGKNGLKEGPLACRDLYEKLDDLGVGYIARLQGGRPFPSEFRSKDLFQVDGEQVSFNDTRWSGSIERVAVVIASDPTSNKHTEYYAKENRGCHEEGADCELISFPVPSDALRDTMAGAYLSKAKRPSGGWAEGVAKFADATTPGCTLEIPVGVLKKWMAEHNTKKHEHRGVDAAPAQENYYKAKVYFEDLSQKLRAAEAAEAAKRLSAPLATVFEQDDRVSMLNVPSGKVVQAGKKFSEVEWTLPDGTHQKSTINTAVLENNGTDLKEGASAKLVPALIPTANGEVLTGKVLKIGKEGTDTVMVQWDDHAQQLPKNLKQFFVPTFLLLKHSTTSLTSQHRKGDDSDASTGDGNENLENRLNDVYISSDEELWKSGDESERDVEPLPPLSMAERADQLQRLKDSEWWATVARVKDSEWWATVVSTEPSFLSRG